MAFYLLLRLGLLTARALPFKRFANLCARLGRAAGHFSPARKVVSANLRAVEAAGGRRADAGEVFESYGRYWGELLALAARPERCAALRMEVSGLEHLIDARGRGAVCALGAHLGNWDLLGHWIARDMPNMAFMVERLRPARLFRLFENIRGSLSCSVLAAEGGGRELYRHLRGGGHAGLLADRVIGAGWRSAPLLGGTRRIPSAGMDLARRAGATLLPIFIRRHGLRFEIRIHPPLDEAEDPVIGFARALESEILAAPEQWSLLYPLHDGEATVAPALAMKKAVAT